MKITIYTVNDCQFSKAEKEYLQTHNLPFEEKNLEQNREWLTEMLAVSNNFAGTPVTKIEKDNNEIIIIKGYNKNELDKALDLSTSKTAVVNADINLPNDQPPTPPPPSTTPTPPPPQQAPVTPPLSNQPLTTDQTQTAPSNTSQNPLQSPTNQTNQPDQQLNSVLDALKQQAEPQPSINPTLNQEEKPTESNQNNQNPTNNLPDIPDFNQ